MKRVCAETVSTGARHFFYGGNPGVAEDLASRLAQEFPRLVIAGTYCPPFRLLTEDELDGVAARINDSRADIVWVGLSTPKQERWIHSIRERLEVGVLVSVGAAFDFHTERIRVAPRWMQRGGLEWFFRLTQEPRRLWRRYALNNPTFAALVLMQITGLRSFEEDE
jgi:N-acetylglucosaminyldiphosphoundecaprenol N-acetyl-beta-D-mannosaminyltransferase